MNNSYSDAYKAAGVDITAGYKAVDLMKQHIARTMNEHVLTGGGFAGALELDLTGINKPVLVTGTDGVGTKLKLAFEMNKHNTIGIDCVAMCVNDVAFRQEQHSSEEKPQRCLVSTRMTSMMWQDLLSVWLTRTK